MNVLRNGIAAFELMVLSLLSGIRYGTWLHNPCQNVTSRTCCSAKGEVSYYRLVTQFF